MRLRRALVAALVMLAGASAARSRPNPPVAEADRSASLNPRTPVPAPVMSTLRLACFDCHSDETRWPWYAALPVASHLIERDVTEARGQLNLSRWTRYNPFDRADLLDKMCRLAASGTMPPWQYRMMHPEARLSTTDVATLCAWSQDEATRLVQGEK
jgi:cytochrome c